MWFKRIFFLLVCASCFLASSTPSLADEGDFPGLTRDVQNRPTGFTIPLFRIGTDIKDAIEQVRNPELETPEMFPDPLEEQESYEELIEQMAQDLAESLKSDNGCGDANYYYPLDGNAPTPPILDEADDGETEDDDPCDDEGGV